MKILMPKDGFVSGKEGAAYATIDGRRYRLFNLKDFNAKAKISSEKLPILGGTPHYRPGDTDKDWSATMYDCTDIFVDILIKYMNTGYMEYITLQIENEDPNSKSGRKSVIYDDCMISESDIQNIDINKPVLESSISGTYHKIRKPQGFKMEGMEV